VLIGVHCDTHREDVPGNDKLKRVVLDRWYIAQSYTDPKRHGLAAEHTSTNVGEFWRVLESIAQVRGTVLVCSNRATETWCLLEFWEGLERGRIHLAGHDSRDNRGNSDCDGECRVEPIGSGRTGCGADRQGDTQPIRGFLVVEDPPTIAYFWLRECPSLIRWIDVRNYGVILPRNTSGGFEPARHIVTFMESMVRQLRERRLGAVKDTSGAQALYSFRRKHLKNAILCHTVKEVLDLEDAAYFAGRCECGRLGRIDGPVYELDIRGSYLFTMRYCPVPCRLRNYVLSTATGECPDFGTPFGIIGEVLLTTEQPDYPYRREGISVWPVGVLKTTLCGPELYDAYDKGRILKWFRWAEYDTEPALSGFADEVYDLRCQAEKSGDKLLAGWAKALAVSLVGKLGQRGKYWEWLPERKPYIMYNQEFARDKDGVVRRYQEIAGYHRREIEVGWADDSVPAIAGWITSAARLRLQTMLHCAGMSECYYYDTDSIFCSAAGFARLARAGWIKDGELGFLQFKGVHQWMEINGIKSYRTPDRHRMAGIPGSGHTNALSVEGFRQSLWMCTYLSMRSKPLSLQKVTSQVRIQPYRHGIRLLDGKVVPLVVNDT